MMGLEFAGDEIDDLAEAENVFGQGEFELRFEADGAGFGVAGFAEDGADAGVGVLEIGGGVAIQRQHLVE